MNFFNHMSKCILTSSFQEVKPHTHIYVNPEKKYLTSNSSNKRLWAKYLFFSFHKRGQVKIKYIYIKSYFLMNSL